MLAALLWRVGISISCNFVAASAAQRLGGQSQSADPPSSAPPPLRRVGSTAITAIWAGDVNADGLDDVCWADWTSNALDGAFQLLWDDGL